MDQTTLHKYFQGNASESEEERILRWVEESEENKHRFKKERLLYDVALFNDNSKNQKVVQTKRINPVIKWSLGIAASILVIISGGLLFSNYQDSLNNQLQTVTVPVGQRAEIALADGTKVWLNSKSTLTYNTSFGRKNRTVELDGEAYFEVTKDAKRPFYVLTENNKVGVIGTSFCVTAYKGSNTFETVLVEGLVDIYTNKSQQPVTRLKRNESYSSDQDSSKVRKVNAKEQLTWKDGIYSFEDETFKVILEKLEKYFNVKFKIENSEILDYPITAKFREQDGIEHILRTIQIDHKFTYIIDTKTDTIIIK